MQKKFITTCALIQSRLGCRAAFQPLTYQYVTKQKRAVSPLTVNKWILGPLCASAEQTVHQHRHCAMHRPKAAFQSGQLSTAPYQPCTAPKQPSAGPREPGTGQKDKLVHTDLGLIYQPREIMLKNVSSLELQSLLTAESAKKHTVANKLACVCVM